MKLLQSQRREAGSILMVTVFTTAIIGVVLASYLNLVQAQNLAVARSQTWNAAIPAAEAGIEEALAHLNNRGTNSWDTDGWSFNGTLFVLSRTLSGSSYTVSITSNPTPAIEATGFMTIPFKSTTVSRTVRVTTTKRGSGFKGMVAKGGISLGPGSEADSYDSRLTGPYSAGSKRDKGFVGSVGDTVTGGTIYGDVATGPTGAMPTSTVGPFGWTGPGIAPGHYDNDLNLSFPDVVVPGGTWFTGLPAGGTISEVTVTINSNTVTSATHPGAGYTVITNNSTLTGSLYYQNGAWVTNYPVGATVISSVNAPDQTQHKNTAFPGALTYIPGAKSGADSAVSGSTRSWVPQRIVTYTGTTYTYNTVVTNSVSGASVAYDYIFDNSNYKISSFKLSGQKKVYVKGNVKIHCEGEFDIGGQVQMVMAPDASLELYVGGDVKIAGNGIMNPSADATKLTLLGLNSCDEIKIAGNGEFTGVIYAPYATLKGAGGGNDDLDLKGAAVVNEVNFAGHFSFHYDERLGDEGGAVQFVIASWNEI